MLERLVRVDRPLVRCERIHTKNVCKSVHKESIQCVISHGVRSGETERAEPVQPTMWTGFCLGLQIFQILCKLFANFVNL